MDFHPNQELGGNPTNNQPDLASLLGAAFHFASFRPNQEAVCRAAIQGRDVLLVMPTGSGNLCVTNCLAWREVEQRSSSVL